MWYTDGAFGSRGISSAGRAPGSQSGGQGFEPPMLHQNRGDRFCGRLGFLCGVALEPTGLKMQSMIARGDPPRSTGRVYILCGAVGARSLLILSEADQVAKQAAQQQASQGFEPPMLHQKDSRFCGCLFWWSVIGFSGRGRPSPPGPAPCRSGACCPKGEPTGLKRLNRLRRRNPAARGGGRIPSHRERSERFHPRAAPNYLTAAKAAISLLISARQRTVPRFVSPNRGYINGRALFPLCFKPRCRGRNSLLALICYPIGYIMKSTISIRPYRDLMGEHGKAFVVEA